MIDTARVSYQPQEAREMWAQKWSQRPSPGRAGDPPARVNGDTPIAGAWVLAEDRWSICEQTEGKCFLRLCALPSSEWQEVAENGRRPSSASGLEG